jgi:hypothetical protein
VGSLRAYWKRYDLSFVHVLCLSYCVGCKEYVWLHKNLLRKYFLSDVIKSCLFVKFQTKKLRDEHTDDMSVLKAFTLVLERRPDLRLVIHGIQTLCSYRLLSFSLGK